MTTVDDRRRSLASQIAEPVTGDLDRWLADCQAQSERLDEEHRLLGIGRTAAICMTHEITGSWDTATASRWYLALPERYMTPDSLARPDWDHSHYPHDGHGRIGRVTTRQRPETEADRQAGKMVAAILADLGEPS
jgi:hypothetical protein